MTKRFAVAYLSLHDGELKLEFVTAVDELTAALLVLPQAFNNIECVDLHELQGCVGNCDGWLEVKEILT